MNRGHYNRALRAAVAATLLAMCVIGRADDNAPVEKKTDIFLGMELNPQKGFEILLNEPMAQAILKVDDIDRLWKIWEPEEKAKAEAASPEERVKMTFKRYGWAERPEGGKIPLDYTPDGKGSLVTNCFSCHGGKVAGKTIPGAGNTHVDLTGIATDVMRLRSLDGGRSYEQTQEMKDVIAPFKTPLNYHKGVTNAVIFAPMFAALRNPELAKDYTAHPEKLLHHDMNAPAWWLFKKKTQIYCDGFAPKTPRQLMPFAMSPVFSDEKFHSFEPNFVQIYAYIDALEAPRYPYPVNAKLAAEGKELFEISCASCHGTYGPDGKFPQKVIPIDKIKTDRRRMDAISSERRYEGNSHWLQYFGEYPLVMESEGYMAQPLDGIWASAPYFHNGAVPTIWAVLNSAERPNIWKRDDDGYDQKNVGLQVEKVKAVPEGLSPRLTRQYYNTATLGSSNGGHTFPDEELNQEEKVAVMEYLKTL